MAKRIIKAMRSNVVIGDIGNHSINLRTIGDTIDLLAPVIQGRGRKSRFTLEEISNSTELDRLINDGSIELYNENNNIIGVDGTTIMTKSDTNSRYPYVLANDTSNHVGGGSKGEPDPNEVVKTILIPADTLSNDGSAIHVYLTFYKESTLTAGDFNVEIQKHLPNIYGNHDPVSVYEPTILEGDYTFETKFIRTSVNSLYNFSKNYAGSFLGLNFNLDQDLVIRATTGVTLQFIRVEVSPFE